MNIVTVEFPLPPDTTEYLGIKTLGSYADSAAYVIQIQEFNDSAIAKYGIQGFCKEVAAGILERIRAGQVRERLFEKDGFKGVEIEFVTKANPQLPDVYSYRIIIYRTTLLCFSFSTYSKCKSRVMLNKLRYFNSIIPTK